MRVLLVSPNRERLPDPVYPLGLAYVAGALEREGHQVRAVDLLLADDPREALGLAIGEFEPQVVGISLRNIDDVSYPKAHSYVEEYRDTVQAVRELTDAPLVLGGSGFTIMPRRFMRVLAADYGVVGEGEEALPLLLRNLNGSKRLVSGRKLGDLDGQRPAAGHFDASAYYRMGGMLNVQTKRGCSFRCIYCTYPRVEGRRVRLRGPGAVADEMERLVDETGVRHFFIVDGVFNNPPAHAASVCRELIHRRLDVRWSCYCTPRGMSPELTALMLRAGCTGVEFGTDSLLDEGLSSLGKSFAYETVQYVSSECRRQGLKFCHFIFVGSPGESMDDVRASLGRMEELEPDAAVVMAGIRVFPGTDLARMTGMTGSRAPGLEPVFYVEPSVRQKMEAVRDMVAEHRNWIMPGFEVNMHERLQRMLRDSGIKGSLWEGLVERYGR